MSRQGECHLPPPRLGKTIAATGRSVVTAVACTQRTEEELEATLPLLATAGRASLSSGEWRDGWYRRDFSPHRPGLTALAKLQHSRFGRLNTACLLSTPVLGHDLLLHATGRPLSASDLSGLRCDGVCVNELLDIHWETTNVLRFRLKDASYPYPAVTAFRTLCDTLVMCYPALLRPQDPLEYLSERRPTTDLWLLRREADGIHLIHDVAEIERHDLGVVTTLRQAEALARRATARPRLQFSPHPALCVTLPLWGTVERFSKKSLRSHVANSHRIRALAEVERRADAAHELSADFGDALSAIDWSEVHALRHSTSRQRLNFHRVKGLRLSGWDALHERRGCPHCAALGPDGGTTFHIVWTCPSAQRLWRTVRSWWEALGLWTTHNAPTDREFLTAVFSLKLPRTPPKAWDLASLSQCPPAKSDTQEGPYPALQDVWQQVVLETLVVILNWRARSSDPERSWTPRMASVVHDASCQRVLDTLAHRYAQDARLPATHVPLVREVRELFAHPQPAIPPPPPNAAAVHVLFFDGGSRGNPGPGGSGACVVRVGTSTGNAEIVWSAAMSHASPSTTNNQAEYGGLLTGLRAARSHDWSSLEVVGDSMMIIRQLRDYRPPKNARLLPLYSEARRLGDQLDVRRWTHHVRANNRMADALANHAMDGQTSSQVSHPTARPGHAELHAHLGTDLRPWLASFLGRHVESMF